MVITNAGQRENCRDFQGTGNVPKACELYPESLRNDRIAKIRAVSECGGFSCLLFIDLCVCVSFDFDLSFQLLYGVDRIKR